MLSPILTPSPQLQSPLDEVQAMSLDFARWFYALVNEDGGSFGPEHFWPDCRLLVSLQNSSLQVQEVSALPSSYLLEHCVTDVCPRSGRLVPRRRCW